MATPQKIAVLCESTASVSIVKNVVRALKLEAEVEVTTVGKRIDPDRLLGVYRRTNRNLDPLQRTVRLADLRKDTTLVAVFDLDFGAPRQGAPRFSKINGVWLSPAVPNVESWLLSDPRVYSIVADGDKTNYSVEYDDYISDSGLHFINEKGRRRLLTRRIGDTFDLARAVAASPSLRAFSEIMMALGAGESPPVDDVIPSTTIARLLQDAYPQDLPLYRSLSGSVLTGGQMVREIEIGTDLGRQYASDLLRVCRDILGRQAARYRS